MPESLARATFRQRLCMAATQDERIVGLLMLGSGSDERLDEWSDIDSLFFLKDADFEPFVHEWRGWATQFGEMVLVYEPLGFPSTLWTIYHAETSLLRVEYILRPESQLDTILSLTASPRSVEAMVCCDKTGGLIKNSVEQLVGRSLRLPASEERPTFKDRCDTLWYGLVYARTEIRKRQVEFLAFLSQLERELPSAATRVFLVMDNLKMHKGKLVQAWLATHPRFVCHFVPVHCSWMNQVEQWFSMLQRKRLRISDFASLAQVAERLRAYVSDMECSCTPF